MKLGYKNTIVACFAGSAILAVTNNFTPLLFLTFQNTYGIPLSKITLLVTLNFAVQLIMDLVSAYIGDKVGYRRMIVFAHICGFVGMSSMAILPELVDPFVGLLLSVIIYAIGNGILEVMISPVIEACPTDNKEKAMSLLHSFYCWGYAVVVLLSTVFFAIFGLKNWKILTLIWATFPLVNGIVFCFVPITHLIAEGEKGFTIIELFKNKMFWLMVLLMLCAGAAEQSVSQWASVFAEKGLGVSKAIGDLTGPMLFAITMGVARAFYGKFGHKIKLDRFMFLSGLLCLGSYLLVSLSPIPALALVGSAVCGFSVGIMWPGSLSLASNAIRRGGTAMFGLLALAGDVGCMAGPTLVGFVSDSLNDNLQIGILVSIIFPVLLLVGLVILYLTMKKKNNRIALEPPLYEE